MKIKAAFLLLLLAPAARAADPDASALLRQALATPSVSFQGDMVLTHWEGPRARTEEARVSFKPPRFYRCEFLSPAGATRRVVVSDGAEEYIQLADGGKTFRGAAINALPPRLDRAEAFALLEKNYRAAVVGAETVAGRPCWVVALEPRAGGKAGQKMWVDKETDVVLEMKRFLGDDSRAASMRFVRFAPRADLSADLFQPPAASAHAVHHGLNPDTLSLEALNGASKKPLPPELPAGFAFENGNRLALAGASVLHARYSDGLAAVSVFRSDKPVKASGEALDGGADAETGILRWKKGGSHYVLMGDVSKDLLQTLSAALP